MADYQDVSQNRQLAPADQFPKMLEKMKPQIEAALPSHLNADRMMRIALTEFRRNPKLGQCDLRSTMGAIVTLSQLGLEPGVLGQAYLVPYGNVCQPIPGWQGFVDLVSRTGRATVWTGCVRQGDDFDYAYGDRPFIVHKPGDDEEAPILYFYSVGRVNGAEWPVIEVWTAKKVENHRNRFNKVGNQHYSYQHWEMYGRKVPLLQVIKYMPKSVELQQAVDMESAAETGRVFEGSFTDLGMAPDDTPTPPPADKPAADKPPRAKKASKKKAAESPPQQQQSPPAEPSGAPEPIDRFPDAIREISLADDKETLGEIKDRVKASTMLPADKKEKLNNMIASKIESLDEEESGAAPSGDLME